MSKLTNLDFIERSKKMEVFDEYIFLKKGKETRSFKDVMNCPLF